jgi:hypothetical protein
MFESFPKQPNNERSDEKPRPKLAAEKSGNEIPDESATLRQIEERAKRFNEVSFLSLERNLDLVLSGNALESYKKAGYVLKNDDELPFYRLTDLGTTLMLLERFKDRLPNRYQANIKKVLDHQDTIKHIFLDYRSLREQGQGHDIADASALLWALEYLQKIGPEKFPSDLVDVSPEERKQMESMKRITLRADSKDGEERRSL